LLAGLAERTKFKLKCVGSGALKWDNLEASQFSILQSIFALKPLKKVINFLIHELFGMDVKKIIGAKVIYFFI
jgi:hypothetical protein